MRRPLRYTLAVLYALGLLVPIVGHILVYRRQSRLDDPTLSPVVAMGLYTFAIQKGRISRRWIEVDMTGALVFGVLALSILSTIVLLGQADFNEEIIMA